MKTGEPQLPDRKKRAKSQEIISSDTVRIPTRRFGLLLLLPLVWYLPILRAVEKPDWDLEVRLGLGGRSVAASFLTSE